MPRYGLGHNPVSHHGMKDAVKKIQKETGCSWLEAVGVAAMTLEGAGENERTVESTQTCRDAGGGKVPGLTTDDSLVPRKDPFADSIEERGLAAEEGTDEASMWLRERGSKK